MNKSRLNALAVAMGLASTLSATSVTAAVQYFDWGGVLRILDPVGAAVANNSLPAKGNNQYDTPISGNMAFDDATGAGTATLVPFDYFSGSLPVEAVSFNMQAIGDGMGGAGSLVLGNMLFNWDGIYGIPVSIVMDATGIFGATAAMWGDGVLDQADVAGYGAVPASDGTYVGTTVPGTVNGYLALGPVPMATTEWNLTRATACGIGWGNCMGVGTSGLLPLVTDTVINNNEYVQGIGVGGVPMWDGPFTGFSPNFDFTSFTYTGTDPEGFIAPFYVGPEVPVPATIWLFGSGLLGLVGLARRKPHKS